MKQAILLVSFGTTHIEQLEKSIESGVHYIKSTFPDREVRLAFSSRMILNKLMGVVEKDILFIEDALERLKVEGYEKVVIQPLHLIEGKEYEKVLEFANNYRFYMKIEIAKVLFKDKANYKMILNEIVAPYRDKEEILVLLGHGTSHEADVMYEYLRQSLERIYPYGFISTLQSIKDVEFIAQRVKSYGRNKVTIIPLMLVAGNHIQVDVKGEGENRWEGRFLNHGIDVEIVECGLGEYPFIHKIFESHIKEVEGAITDR